MFEKLWIRARRSMTIFGIEFIPISQDADGSRTAYIKEIIWEECGPGVSPPSVCRINIDDVSAKALMDDLWKEGIRPSKELWGDPNKEDMKYHLEDLRSMLFGGYQLSKIKEVDAKKKD